MCEHEKTMERCHDMEFRQGISYINVKFRKLPRMITKFTVYHPGILTELEKENLQDRILADLVEAENAMVGPQKMQAIC